VELERRYSNRFDLHERLAEVCRKARERSDHDDEDTDVGARSSAARPWSIRNRLSNDDILQIIAEFLAGTSKRLLAERYAISVTSVKTILRQHGVRRA